MFKRIATVICFVAIVSVSAFASGLIGPPTANLEKGQWTVGYNYMQSEADMGKINVKWNEYLNGAFDDSGVDTDQFQDVTNERHYASFGYGFSDSWEVYFQLGLAGVEADIVNVAGVTTELDFGNDIAWGWGTRFTLFEKGDIRWGTSIQMNWLDTSTDITQSSPGFSEKTTYNFETMDLLIAFGPTVDMGKWQLYGGPFFYQMSGDYTEDGWDSDGWTWDGKADLESQSSFGGFIGAQIPLWENSDMIAEISFTGDSWSIGTGVTWKF